MIGGPLREGDDRQACQPAGEQLSRLGARASPSPECSGADLPEEICRLGDLLLAVGRRLRREGRDATAACGITHGQARALEVLSQAGAPLRMADLAARLDVVPRSATDAVDALVGSGLALRTTQPGDRRLVLVALSDDGRVVVSRLRHARASGAARVLAPLSPGERAALARLLCRLTDAPFPRHGEPVAASGTCAGGHDPAGVPGGAGAPVPDARRALAVGAQPGRSAEQER